MMTQDRPLTDHDLSAAVLDSFPEPVAILDAGGRVTAANEAWLAFARDHPDHLPAVEVGGNFLDACHGPNAPTSFKDGTAEEIAKVLKGTASRAEVDYPVGSGAEERWLCVQVTPLRHPDGGAVVRQEDITERKRTVLTLRQAKERAEQQAKTKDMLLSAVNAFFIGLNEDNVVTEWTFAAERLFGVSLCDTIGVRFDRLPINWDWTEVLSAVESCRSSLNNMELSKLATTSSDGRPAFVRLVIRAMLSDREIGIVIMGEDVTERLLTERDLAQTQKWESIGQLAAGIAHEINTPTQYIGDNARFLKDSFADLLTCLRANQALLAAAKSGPAPDRVIREAEEAERRADLGYLLEEIPKSIDQSLEGISRVTSIVRAMKEFAHPDTSDKTLANINRAIESTVSVTRHEWKYVSDVNLDLTPDLPLVPCLLGDISQVLLNLIVNAAHAIEAKKNGQKGAITIRTKRVGEWVEIRIEDTGTGIPESIRDKIFDPFFTTKEVGKGTGQGLAITRSVIAKKHGGTIAFESEVGKGTTFIVRLPLDPQAVATAK